MMGTVSNANSGLDLMSVRRLTKQSEALSLGVTRLYRDELEAIVRAVAEIGEVKIRCDSYEATDANDFAQLPERPQLTLISAVSPNGESKIEIQLTEAIAQAELTEPDTHMWGVLNRIQTICKESRAPFLQGFWPSSLGKFLKAMFLVAALTLIFTLFARVAFSRPTWPVATLEGFCIVLFIVIIVNGIGRRFEQSSGSAIVVNAYRSTRPSFFQRTRDDWIVHVIVGMFFLIVGFLIGSFTHLHGG